MIDKGTEILYFRKHNNSDNMTNVDIQYSNPTRNILQSEYKYNKANLLTSLVNKNSTSTLSSSSYSYNFDGNMRSKTQNGNTTEYTYDDMARLVGETVKKNNAVVSNMSYTYDDAGNRTSLTATGRENYITNYTYDKNNRLSKTVNGAKTNFLWDGDDMFMSINDSESRSYTKAPGYMRTASNKETNSEKDEYYLFNGHGDVTGITDINGNVKKNNYDYDAFGNERAIDVNDTNPFRYCGEYYDNETGLIYLRNRYYDSSTGRFINEDPVKDGLNWYSYCGDNPITYIDPYGDYYIKQEVTYTMDMDPRNKNFAKPTGRYYIEPETISSAARSIAISCIPAGGLINYTYELMTLTKGGNSATGLGDMLADVRNVTIDKGIKKLGIPFLKSMTKIVSGISFFKSVADKIDYRELDNLSLELMSKNGISKYSRSIDVLETRMEKSYAYLALNSDYFFSETNFNSKTPYEIDKIISESKHPSDKINEYYKKFISMGASEMKALGLKTYLDHYKDRLDVYNNLYRGYIEP